MKRIFFLLSAMNIGGVEKSFLSLLSIIPREQYEIHLGLICPQGGYMEYIPKDVQIHSIDCYNDKWRIINDPPLQIIRGLIQEKKWIEAFIHLLLYLHFKMTGNRYWFYKYLLRNKPTMKGHFDIAIAYAGPSQAIDYYICKKVNANTKIGWIHFDVTRFGIDRGMTRKLYPNYKKIFIVSEMAKERFDSLFPTLKDRTEVFRNIVPVEQIPQLAEQGNTFTDNYTGIRILTVGRISKEKGQDIAIQALKILLEKGIETRWYFVGDGNMRKEYELLAQKLQINNHIIFLGTQVNPYAYMRDCDIYMQPSRHEGFCITLAEALCFTNPVVATNFAGAEEQLKSRENGKVCGMSAEEIADAVPESISKL